MAKDKDVNDALDDIFLAENKAYHDSYQEGYAAGLERGNPNSYHAGYHQGAEVGREVGYYLQVVLNQIEAVQNGKVQHSDKAVKAITETHERIQAFPCDGTPDQITAELEQLRVLYKKMCALTKISSALPFKTDVSF